jgi:hypothetical protein
MRARRLVFVGHAVAERVDGVSFLVYRAYGVVVSVAAFAQQRERVQVIERR